jgi:hypothetical protein
LRARPCGRRRPPRVGAGVGASGRVAAGVGASGRLCRDGAVGGTYWCWKIGAQPSPLPPLAGQTFLHRLHHSDYSTSGIINVVDSILRENMFTILITLSESCSIACWSLYMSIH